VPVCVGEEGGPVERFPVRTELLVEPAYAALLVRVRAPLCAAHPVPRVSSPPLRRHLAATS
jgi:SAUR family protein